MTHISSTTSPIEPTSSPAKAADLQQAEVAVLGALLKLKTAFSGARVDGAVAQNDLLRAGSPHLAEVRAALVSWAHGAREACVSKQPRVSTLAPVAQSLLFEAPLLRDAQACPRAFAGGASVEIALAGSPFQGETAYAQLTNYFWWSLSVGRAYRQRLREIPLLLSVAAARAAAVQRPLRVLQLGAGAGLEVARFLQYHAPAEGGAFTLVDPDARALSAATALHRGILANTRGSASLAYECMDWASLLSAGTEGQPPYDLILATGCSDQLSTAQGKRLAQFCASRLDVDGRCLWTSTVPNADQALLSAVLGETGVWRSSDQLLELLPSGPRFMLSLKQRDDIATAVAHRIR